ncbi:MAG: hypothetical protein M0Z56_03410 [Desulfobacteraceae bacterium]|nr:hypothetical protein [Desulfobacteraceae bacterium]
MTLESLRDVFMRCAIINYGVLLVWFLVFAFAHDWISHCTATGSSHAWSSSTPFIIR